MRKKITVMIAGVGGGSHGEQILKALRMASTPYIIVGTDISPFSKGLKEVDYPCLLPPAKDPRYIQAVLKVCRRHKVKALFHGSEIELKILSRYRKLLYQEGIFLPFNPPEVIELCMNKRRTFEFLKEKGFLYPKTRVLKNIHDAGKWNYFPAILKPSIGSGGSAYTFIVQNKHELKIIADYMLNLKVCTEVIVQEYVGNSDTEFTVGVLFDMEGKLINSIAVRRNLGFSLSSRMHLPNRTGTKEHGPYLAISSGVSQGEIGSFPEVTAICEKVAAALGARGAINIQCRVQRGKVYIFEINPRFSGTTSIRALVGYNEPDILIRKHVLGENIKFRFPYKTGIVIRGLREVFFEADWPNKVTKYNE